MICCSTFAATDRLMDGQMEGRKDRRTEGPLFLETCIQERPSREPVPAPRKREFKILGLPVTCATSSVFRTGQLDNPQVTMGTCVGQRVVLRQWFGRPIFTTTRRARGNVGNNIEHPNEHEHLHKSLCCSLCPESNSAINRKFNYEHFVSDRLVPSGISGVAK